MIVVELGQPPSPPLSLNRERSLHWAARNRELEPWKDLAIVMARQLRLRKQIGGTPCAVAVELPFSKVRRRDPHNYAPTIKAIIDGLVDAGVWPDDTAEWVEVLDPILTVAPAPVRIRLYPKEAPPAEPTLFESDAWSSPVPRSRYL